MHQRIVQQTLLMLYFLLSFNGVQGEKKLFKLDDVEIEKQLNILNKPAVKTVKTKYGDIYDCVDFYKQRAFDHPLLKDHNFHPKMKPTFKEDSSSSSTANSWSLTIWSKDGGCPFGTVPVKKITKEDLKRLRHMPPPEDITFDSDFDVSNNISEPKGISSQGYKVSIARTPNNPNNKFSGAGMLTSLYNPRVEGKQHSASRLKVQKGSDILQVGWRVDPTLYGDSETRFFIHFQAGKIQCFNTLCPGFVHVNNKMPLDLSYWSTISERGGRTWEATMYIQQDLVNGNWWVLTTQNLEQVGFWPQRIFTDLKSFATNIEWGGVVYSPPAVPLPPMGSSYFPVGNLSFDGYCAKVTILNQQGKTIEVDRTTLHNDISLYKVQFEKLRRGYEYVYFVLYGGPGESGPV
ncbi:unnamed protein product [Withania somnifera]